MISLVEGGSKIPRDKDTGQHAQGCRNGQCQQDPHKSEPGTSRKKGKDNPYRVQADLLANEVGDEDISFHKADAHKNEGYKANG